MTITISERKILEFWRGNRPGAWTQQRHLEEPFVNCEAPVDDWIAKQAVKIIRQRQRVKKTGQTVKQPTRQVWFH